MFVIKLDTKTCAIRRRINPTRRSPGLHSWLHLNYFIRDVNHADGDIASFWMTLPLQELVHSCLQEDAQFRLGKPWEKSISMSASGLTALISSNTF